MRRFFIGYRWNQVQGNFMIVEGKKDGAVPGLRSDWTDCLFQEHWQDSLMIF